jgi:ABC-type multidrug transport system ATPase subunit
MKITELTKSFDAFQIDIRDFTFAEGMIHGLGGPNGCGKSTLGKLIMGTLAAQSREIDFGGLGERDITMISQNPYIKHFDEAETRREVDRLLTLCGLQDMRKDNACGLSMGQRQKLSIARAFIFKPKFIIMDENLSNLDPDSVELFETEILRMQKETPVTWIIISHQLAHIRRLCDKIHFMAKGRIQASGSFEEVFGERQEAPELRRYIVRETLSF